MTSYGDLTPVNIVTSFLGSGKTTLLQRLLRSPQLSDALVLVNEFGEVGLDHHLLQGVAESTLLLENGCLCCAVRGDLQKALREQLSRRTRGEVPHFRRVVIETSGLADPAPIAYTLLSEAVLRHHFRLSGIITTVDAVNGTSQIGSFAEAAKQIAMADRLVLTKTDLANGQPPSALRAQLRALNVSAEIVESSAIGDDFHRLFREASRWTAEEAGGHDHGSHDHTAAVRSFVVTFDRPLDWTAFGVWATIAPPARRRHAAPQGTVERRRRAYPGADQRRSAHRPSAEPSRRVARRGPALASHLHRARAAASARRALACGVQRSRQCAGSIVGRAGGAADDEAG
jgi:G3E family GTPase